MARNSKRSARVSARTKTCWTKRKFSPILCAMTKPLLLVHPPLPGFQERLARTYRVATAPLADEVAADVQAIVTVGSKGVSNAMLEKLPALRAIICFGAGYDGVDVAFAKARGVAVTNCPNVNNEDVADVAIGLMLSAARRLSEGERIVREGRWTGLMAVPPVRRVRGRRLGIVGLGAIGLAVGSRAEPFGLEIAWTGPRPKPDAPYRFEPSLPQLATWADVLIVCAAATAENAKMIDAAVLSALGPEGLLVNVGRGSLVDEEALIAALKSGALGSAALDVFEAEPTPAARWADVPNITLSPHLAGGTLESLIESGALVIENLRCLFAGEPLKTPL